MLDMFSRSESLLGKENIKKLNNMKVAIFGIGGVGSYVVEGLVRGGIQNFILVDHDKIDITNLNRQLHTNQNNIGKYKVDEMKKRILEINPKAQVETYKIFYMPENTEIKLDNSVDYIVDAIDTVAAKIELITKATKLNIPIISSMGTGNKLDPTKFEVTDINKTSVCPLAKVIRKELKKRNINKLKVVYSKEEPLKNIEENVEKSKSPGSVSFVPSVAGLIIAGEVIKDLIKK